MVIVIVDSAAADMRNASPTTSAAHSIDESNDALARKFVSEPPDNDNAAIVANSPLFHALTVWFAETETCGGCATCKVSAAVAVAKALLLLRGARAVAVTVKADVADGASAAMVNTPREESKASHSGKPCTSSNCAECAPLPTTTTEATARETSERVLIVNKPLCAANDCATVTVSVVLPRPTSGCASQ